jgi:hypothetical protein
MELLCRLGRLEVGLIAFYCGDEGLHTPTCDLIYLSRVAIRQVYSSAEVARSCHVITIPIPEVAPDFWKE